MGGTFYSNSARSFRSESMGFATKSFEKLSEQTVKRQMHPQMDPKGVTFRECRDSEAHPNAVPILFYLDLTGSMGQIPNELIKDGLPTLMSKLIQNGVPDAALMFAGVGDHECDSFPLQVSQFESGDAELDMWLLRTCLEKGGGGNAGESYGLAWYFSANHVVTDAWEKRKQKGFLITCGDEPNLTSYPMSAIRQIMGETAIGKATYTEKQLLELAQEKWNVYHIFVQHASKIVNSKWQELLGQNLIIVKSAEEVPEAISKIVILNSQTEEETPSILQEEITPVKSTEIIL